MYAEFSCTCTQPFLPSNPKGGVKKLFRKVDNRSAEYCLNEKGTTRRDGSYIIEEFKPTQGTDLKVYTVGS